MDRNIFIKCRNIFHQMSESFLILNSVLNSVFNSVFSNVFLMSLRMTAKHEVNCVSQRLSNSFRPVLVVSDTNWSCVESFQLRSAEDWMYLSISVDSNV